MDETTRTLIVSSHTPALGTGRGMRTYGLVRALATLGPVDLLYGRFGPSAPSPAYERLDDVTLYEVVPARGMRRALTFGAARAFGVPGPVARGTYPELAAAASRLARSGGRVVADDPMAAVALGRLARRRPVIYSAHNLESAFRTDWGPVERLRRFERRVLERSVENWMPSRADLDAAARLAPAARLRLAPNVVDVAAISPVAPPAGRREALMVADFTYAPNREGLEFLLADVLPRVWAREPELGVSVVGRGLDRLPAVDERVRFLGFVDDLEAAYRSASCALVPLLHGGGSPLKFVEALAHALPVVATPRAAAGLDVRAGEHYLEGDGPEGFASAIVAALEPGRAAAVGAAGRALAEREYSIESLATRLREPAPGR